MHILQVPVFYVHRDNNANGHISMDSHAVADALHTPQERIKHRCVACQCAHHEPRYWFICMDDMEKHSHPNTRTERMYLC